VLVPGKGLLLTFPLVDEPILAEKTEPVLVALPKGLLAALLNTKVGPFLFVLPKKLDPAVKLLSVGVVKKFGPETGVLMAGSPKILEAEAELLLTLLVKEPFMEGWLKRPEPEAMLFLAVSKNVSLLGVLLGVAEVAVEEDVDVDRAWGRFGDSVAIFCWSWLMESSSCSLVVNVAGALSLEWGGNVGNTKA
jgi:hypothetical protein